MLEKEILNRALLEFGNDNQIRMLQEECAELIMAINKYFRTNFVSFNTENFFEEIADVEIMIGQMKIIFGEEKINGFKKQKLERLEKLLEEKNVQS